MHHASANQIKMKKKALWSPCLFGIHDNKINVYVQLSLESELSLHSDILLFILSNKNISVSEWTKFILVTSTNKYEKMWTRKITNVQFKLNILLTQNKNVKFSYLIFICNWSIPFVCLIFWKDTLPIPYFFKIPLLKTVHIKLYVNSKLLCFSFFFK